MEGGLAGRAGKSSGTGEEERGVELDRLSSKTSVGCAGTRTCGTSKMRRRKTSCLARPSWPGGRVKAG